MKNSRIRYRPGAPGGTRRRAIASNEKKDKWGFNDASRTLMRDPRKPWQPKGGYEENNSNMRSLRKLPWSIASDRGGVD
jgi:hypothetical protein